jgi:hypothetical protein
MKDISHMNKTNDTQKQEMERTSQKKNNFIKELNNVLTTSILLTRLPPFEFLPSISFVIVRLCVWWGLRTDK